MKVKVGGVSSIPSTDLSITHACKRYAQITTVLPSCLYILQTILGYLAL